MAAAGAAAKSSPRFASVHPTPADVLLSPVFTGEALADAWLTEAQAGIAAQAWEDAEATLSDVRHAVACDTFLS